MQPVFGLKQNVIEVVTFLSNH